MFWLYAILFILGLIISWVLAILGLGGTWVMVGISALYAWLIPDASPFQLGWGAVVTLVILAALGELFEFLAGALGAKKAGGSRRSVILSVMGSILGSILGAVVGSAVLPVIGTLIGVIVFAGFGAMGGSVLGERWKGKAFKESMNVGKAAFWGRVLGTVAKTMFGTVMTFVGTVALFV